jgi:hypothetical protein
MTPPRIVVRYFDASPTGKWSRMVRVLASSVLRHATDWALDVQTMPPSDLYSPRGVQGEVHNTRKLDAWTEAVAAATDGSCLLLIDADTLLVRDIDGIWDEPFDLAYTTKPKGHRFPFNGGVIFLRVSDRTRGFFRKWQQANALFMRDQEQYNVWRGAHGGINQSALGMLLSPNQPPKLDPFKNATDGLTIRRLPCLEWNCEDEHWDRFDPSVTRIVHVKGALNRAMFPRPDAPVAVTPGMRVLMKIWREAEEESESTPEPITVPDVPPLRDTSVTPGDIQIQDPQRLNRRERRRRTQTEHGGAA